MRVNTQSLRKSLDENDASAMELVAGSGLDAGEDALDTPCQVRRRRSCKHSQGGSRRRREPTSKMRPRADTASPRAARSPTISEGGDRTYCRMGTSGSTRSTKWCAVSCIRLAPQLGQSPRPLHENGSARSAAQSGHRSRMIFVARAEGEEHSPSRAGHARRARADE